MNEIITIDGPSASGKTSVAKLVAQRLGRPYISSGLLYRAVAWLCLQENATPQEVENRLGLHTLELIPEQENQIWLDRKNITENLHSLEVDATVSAVAVIPGVRAYVNQALGKIPPPFVIDGRDMGSAVFPNAGYKFYLTARPEVRAKRRVSEREAGYAQVLAEIIRRDEADKAQSAPARDAILLDTDDLNLEGVVQKILEHINRH